MRLDRIMYIVIWLLLVAVAFIAFFAFHQNAKRNLEKGNKRSFRYDTSFATVALFFALILIWIGIKSLFLT